MPRREPGSDSADNFLGRFESSSLASGEIRKIRLCGIGLFAALHCSSVSNFGAAVPLRDYVQKCFSYWSIWPPGEAVRRRLEELSGRSTIGGSDAARAAIKLRRGCEEVGRGARSNDRAGRTDHDRPRLYGMAKWHFQAAARQGPVSRVLLTNTTETSSFDDGRFTTTERDFSC